MIEIRIIKTVHTEGGNFLNNVLRFGEKWTINFRVFNTIFYHVLLKTLSLYLN